MKAVLQLKLLTLISLSCSLTFCSGQSTSITESVFCQDDDSITYTCVINPSGITGVFTWVVNSVGLNAFIEGVSTMVGTEVTDTGSRGLTANITAVNGDTYNTMLTIGPQNRALIGTVVICDDAIGTDNDVMIVTDTGPPDVQSISVTSFTLSTLNVDFELSNPNKEDCIERYLVEDEQTNTVLCNTTSPTTMVECSGLNLCTRSSLTLVGYVTDGVSEGDRSSSVVITPDHSQYPDPEFSAIVFVDGDDAYVSVSWQLDDLDPSIHPAVVGVVVVPNVNGVAAVINVIVSDQQRESRNYTADTPSSLTELNGTICCVGYDSGFCVSMSCLDVAELPRIELAPNVTCERLQPSTKGNISFSDDSLRVGTIASYNSSCSPGYRLVGKQTRICQINGEWDGSAPSCECSFQLQFLPSVNKGTLMIVDCTEATYSVDSGYCPSTFVAKYECSNPECSNGQWMYPPTSACVAVGTAVGITFVLTFIFSLALGIIIRVISVLLWNKFKRAQYPDNGDVELKDTSPSAAVAIYEEPEVMKKEPEDVETSGNVAYGSVNTRH